MQVVIRPLEENDAKTSYVWRNDPDIWKYTGSSPDREITLADELVWVKRVTNDDTCRRFAILADGEYVGNIYLTNIHKDEAEYHIFIGNKEYMGKGVAMAASQLIIEFARAELALKRIVLKVRLKNVRAVKLYLALGFKVIVDGPDFLSMSLDLQELSRRK